MNQVKLSFHASLSRTAFENTLLSFFSEKSVKIFIKKTIALNDTVKKQLKKSQLLRLSCHCENNKSESRK